MRYRRCKCGKHYGWSSYSFPPCYGCKECGTTLEVDPKLHKPLKPHTWITKFDEDTGKEYEICKRCFTAKEEIKDAKESV